MLLLNLSGPIEESGNLADLYDPVRCISGCSSKVTSVMRMDTVTAAMPSEGMFWLMVRMLAPYSARWLMTEDSTPGMSSMVR